MRRWQLVLVTRRSLFTSANDAYAFRQCTLMRAAYAVWAPFSPPFLCRWNIYKSSEPLRSSKSTSWNSHTPCYSPSLSSHPLPLLRLRLCTAWTPHVSSLSLYTPRPSPKDSRKLSFVATRKPAALYESSLFTSRMHPPKLRLRFSVSLDVDRAEKSIPPLFPHTTTPAPLGSPTSTPTGSRALGPDTNARALPLRLLSLVPRSEHTKCKLAPSGWTVSDCLLHSGRQP